MNFRRFTKRDGLPPRVADVGNSLLDSLKFLSSGGRAVSTTDFPGDLGRARVLRAAMSFVRAVDVVSSPPTVVQSMVHPSLRALPSTAEVPLAAGFSKNSLDDVLYFGAQEAVELEFDKVAFPEIAASCVMLDHLPQVWRDFYSTPSNLFPPSSERPAKPGPVKPAFRVAEGEYLKIVQRLLALNMVGLRAESQVKGHTGLFGVPKGDAQRLINDCRPVNNMMVDPPLLELPGMDLLSQLHADGEVLVSKYDVANNNNCM